MKKLTLLLATLVLTACSNLSKPVGVYQGTLPCADCDKIEAKLIFNSNNTYQYHTVAFKRQKKLTLLERGKFDWDGDKRGVIRLTNTLSPRLPDLLFKVSKNYVEMCDSYGNVPPASHSYKLYKIAN